MASLKPQPFSIFSETSLSVVYKLQIPSTFGNPPNMGCILIGSCNRLLCITNSKYFGRQLYLWNPTLRKHKILTTSLFTGKSSQRFKHPKTSTVVGLGFDSKTKDYKILRMAFFRWKSRRSKGKQPPQAEIYSLSMDSWRRVEVPDHLTNRFITRNSWNYAYINGAFHWLSVFIDEGLYRSSILSFDVSEERFQELELPKDYVEGIECITQQLVVFKGKLALAINGGGNTCCIWTMDGSFWRKEKVEFGERRWHCGSVGDRLVVSKGYINVYLFDPQTLEEKAVETPKPVAVHPFIQSLALL